MSRQALCGFALKRPPSLILLLLPHPHPPPLLRLKAIAGLQSLSFGQWKQDLIPIKSMPDVLRVVRSGKQLKSGSWVRLRRPATYRDDLAKVTRFYEIHNQVDLQVVPRIDYSKYDKSQTVGGEGGWCGRRVVFGWPTKLQHRIASTRTNASAGRAPRSVSLMSNTCGEFWGPVQMG